MAKVEKVDKNPQAKEKGKNPKIQTFHMKILHQLVWDVGYGCEFRVNKCCKSYNTQIKIRKYLWRR